MLKHGPEVRRTDLQNSFVDVDTLPVYLYREIARRLWEGKEFLETNANIRLMPKKDLSYLSTKIYEKKDIYIISKKILHQCAFAYICAHLLYIFFHLERNFFLLQ